MFSLTICNLCGFTFRFKGEAVTKTIKTCLSWLWFLRKVIAKRKSSKTERRYRKSMTLSRDVRRRGYHSEGCLYFLFNHVLRDSRFQINAHVFDVLTANHSMIWLTKTRVNFRSSILIVVIFGTNDGIVRYGKTVFKETMNCRQNDNDVKNVKKTKRAKC